MTTTSAINTDINNFISAQNQNRGGALAGGGTLALDYNALTGTVPLGGNSVIGISGIAAGAAAISLPTANGNTVIVDGSISTTASTSGADSYSLLINTSGSVTLTDNNTGNSEMVTGASYFLFDGAATTSTGAYQSLYIIETGVDADMAAMFNAAFGRVPDLAGLEFYIQQYDTPALPDLHQMAAYFNLSNEFKTLWPTLQTAPDNGGPNDIAYIDALYGKILGRIPNAAEQQFYVNALQGKLTDSNGNPEPASDRADLMVYFSVSPENLEKIAATNGGWLINPADGAVSFGAMTNATAKAVLTSEIGSGIVTASSFANMSNSSQTMVFTPTGATTITGADYGAGTAAQEAAPGITTSNPNTTIDLSSQYFLGSIAGSNDTLNGAPNGGTIAVLPSIINYPALSASVNDGGTVNLFGNINWIQFGNPTYAVSVPTVINGWNATDIILGPNSSGPSYANSAASVLALADGHVLVGSASDPVSGTSISTTSLNATAINVGSIVNDSVAAIVTAANTAFHENGNYLTSSVFETTFFFGQDPQGNTMVWYWRGDTSQAGTVLASDITGGIELVGVQATSLTAANFHH